ncbi:hypothetical protein M23134_08294 [Microscilla marina ATCC 23134]|uniref:Uncharacterized protein n=1 Tax=Microscilla marina ATCC 23134 TaxID=313606 RepID=A1ZQH0_MICM2|nr:hypothetical protein M23134_07721 [Microscilla marina ATCC 23134]EAY27342.1 hypothetical protein M23134_08294 [Microscilla marina ATCC 23134]
MGDEKNLCIAKAMELFFEKAPLPEMSFCGLGYFCSFT